MRFLKGDTTDLLKYARNINSHFANKKCQDVIVAARNLMTSEIHNTVKVLGLLIQEAAYFSDKCGRMEKDMTVAKLTEGRDQSSKYQFSHL